ncbi:hypothetical protein [uncultured Pseudokineococcus sp.]|uniref:hypothetical protein n=1 Tax=uncultured Pseudokineococcus sp. TaxID=1642928 RepID=UPI0026286CBA|nr:hypothetical protein [uncultured Pseudokineococcus sp.]
MRRKLATITVAGAIALGGAALAGPALADAAPDAVTGTTQEAAQGAVDAVADRVDRITEALAGLVSDGTLTQDQADEVASTLADALPGPGGPGGPGGLGLGPEPAGLDAAAEVLDLTPEELRDALAQDGATLASVAQEQGVSTDDLVAALVDAARTHLDEEVADGRITQAQADERAADLETRIGELVTTEVGDRPLGPGGHGPGGHGPGGPGGPAEEDPADGATAPQGSADDGATTTPDGTSATPSSWSYAA